MRIYSLLILVCLYQYAKAQENLSGIWKVRDIRITNGPNYTNAVPQLMKVQQIGSTITLEITSLQGDKDSVYIEKWKIGLEKVNETRSSLGAKKLLTFYWNENQKAWEKKYVLFALDNPSQQRRQVSEQYRIQAGTLMLMKKSESLDGKEKENDYTVQAMYQKITAEELEKETAKGRGLTFTEGLTWEQVVEKARKENKYIFVDCYATWCLPCKVMDRDVFPLNMVGDAMNDRFIAVKVQMDSTKNDPHSVKALYPAARHFEKEYSIRALPTYLFFSPKGEPMHKAIGQQKPSDFLKLVDIVKSKPDQQLYTIVNQARKNTHKYSSLPDLAMQLKNQFNEKELAIEIAKIYKNGYLDKLDEKEILKKEHLEFIGEYYKLVETKDKFFKICYEQPSLVDKIKEYTGWADWQVQQAINREYIDPAVIAAKNLGNEPDWRLLERQLQKKYNQQRVTTWILDARVYWYEKEKQWTNYLKYLPKQLARHDLEKMLNPMSLNKSSWKVFLYSNDKNLMKEALIWVEIAIKKSKGTLVEELPIDTKSWLLYKIGHRQEAMKIMHALMMKWPEGHHNRKAYEGKLERMKNEEAVWLKYAADAAARN